MNLSISELQLVLVYMEMRKQIMG